MSTNSYEAAVQAFGFPVIIAISTIGDDIDAVTASGLYTWGNVPSGGTGPGWTNGIMLVFGYASGAAVQFAASRTNAYAIKTRYYNGTTWTAWANIKVT